MIKQIDFWRKVIGLLKKTTEYPTPFRNANYSWHIIHPPMSIDGKEKEPDLVSTKKNNWIISDLTLDPDKDWIDFKDTYREISANILADIASPHYSSDFKENPCLLVFGSEKSVYESKCKNRDISGLTLLPNVNFYPSSETLNDDELKKELSKLENEDLSNPPTSILAVPEMEGDELRRSRNVNSNKTARLQTYKNLNIINQIIKNDKMEEKHISFTAEKSVWKSIKKKAVEEETSMKELILDAVRKEYDISEKEKEKLVEGSIKEKMKKIDGGDLSTDEGMKEITRIGVEYLKEKETATMKDFVSDLYPKIEDDHSKSSFKKIIREGLRQMELLEAPIHIPKGRGHSQYSWQSDKQES